MLFNTFDFIFIFLPITFFAFFGLGKYAGRKASAGVLSFASLTFYAYWDVRYVPLLLLSILFNYSIGHLIEKASLYKRLYLFAGIAGNLSLLGYYKYTAFFLTTMNDVAGTVYSIPSIVLPLGISFFTFTQTAYLVDAYRGETEGCSLIDYCLFVTIFPHLIAGPIINYKNMMPQFLDKLNYRINYDNVSIGLMFFIIGLIKKVVIADSIASGINPAFDNVIYLGFLDAWIASLGYTMQLYFDFSGYSEMAVGLGLMFNMRLPFNFNSPYKATSIIDFWRRWHMTLGYWVKNYLYIPMGGNRAGEFRKSLNLFASMLLIGFWHGAGWTFIVWGALHGIALLINHQWRRWNISLPGLVTGLLTFVLVNFLWVFFRADSITAACHMINVMLTVPDASELTRDNIFWVTRGEKNALIAAIILAFVGPNTQELLSEHFKPNIKWLVTAVALCIVALFHFYRVSDFLYFQF